MIVSSTKIIAHRGASGYAPENTLVCFKKAIEMNADGIELDVHLSKDNKVIVCHDETINRTTNGYGYIKDLTLKEIKKYDAGSWFNKKFKGVKIPTLNEVLKLIKNKDILLNIELKNNIVNYNGLENKVIQLLNSYNINSNVIISSFNHNSLIKVKEIDSSIKVGIIFNKKIKNLNSYAKKFNAYSIHPNYRIVDDNMIKTCRYNNLFLIPYTVNNKRLIRKFVLKNIDALITNYPDKALEIVNNHQRIIMIKQIIINIKNYIKGKVSYIFRVK